MKFLATHLPTIASLILLYSTGRKISASDIFSDEQPLVRHINISIDNCTADKLTHYGATCKLECCIVLDNHNDVTIKLYNTNNSNAIVMYHECNGANIKVCSGESDIPESFYDQSIQCSFLVGDAWFYSRALLVREPQVSSTLLSSTPSPSTTVVATQSSTPTPSSTTQAMTYKQDAPTSVFTKYGTYPTITPQLKDNMSGDDSVCYCVPSIVPSLTPTSSDHTVRPVLIQVVLLSALLSFFSIL